MTDLANTEHVGNTQQDAILLPRSCLVLPLDPFDSEGWFSSDQVIRLTVLHFLEKSMQQFKWKDAISGFPASPGSAEAIVR